MRVEAEFSRPIRIDQIGGDRRPESISATEQERLALSRRFRLRGIGRLDADYSLIAIAGGWQADGKLHADVIQACAASGQDVPDSIEAPFTIRFMAAQDATGADEEVELSEEDCDIMEMEDGRIDMGEAVAQTLALNLNPYPRSPDAESYLKQMGVKQEGEAGALAGLKDLLAKGQKGG